MIKTTRLFEYQPIYPDFDTWPIRRGYLLPVAGHNDLKIKFEINMIKKPVMIIQSCEKDRTPDDSDACRSTFSSNNLK